MTTVSPIHLAAQLRHRGTEPEPLLVDVRTPAEYAGMRIAGSVNIPLADLPDQAGALGPFEVILVCRSGTRAEHARAALRRAGHRHVTVLAGGVLAWEQHGLPVERDAHRWDLERQVRLVAGTAVLAGIIVGFVFRPAVLLSAAVGAGLAGAALTDTCALGSLLSKLPYNRRPAGYEAIGNAGTNPEPKARR